LFTDIEEFDEKYPATDVNKAEDLLMRAMEMGQTNEISLAIEIASRNGVVPGQGVY